MSTAFALALRIGFVLAVALPAHAQDERRELPPPREASPPYRPAGPSQPTPEVRSYPTGERPEDPHLARGYEVYRTTCTACHDTGATNAPVLTDTPAWRKRIAKGKETLYRNAIEGFTGERGFMPPKGGSPGSWSDDDIRAAVDYMVSMARRDARREDIAD